VVDTVPIKARDDAKAGRLGQERNDEWRGINHVPSGWREGHALRSETRPGADPGSRVAPCA